MESDKLFHTPKRIEVLLKVALLDHKKEYNFSDIARELNYAQRRPDLREVLRFLVENSIMEFSHQESILNTKFYRIVKKRIRDFIDELELSQLYYQFHNKYHLPPY